MAVVHPGSVHAPCVSQQEAVSARLTDEQDSHPTMAGIYCTVFASLACGASAFVAPSTMFGTGFTAGLRRTHLGSGLMSSRRLVSRGGATSSAATPPSMTAEHYDYLVIGGGSGGVASARRAATYDAKVIS